MKYSFRIFIFIFVFMIEIIISNPIVEPLISELKLDSTSFILELVDNGLSINLNNCLLATTTDTAYFKSGIGLNSNYLLITQDSLLSTLNIIPSEDIVTFIDTYSGYEEKLMFGNSSVCQIRPPLPNQSICLEIGGLYYLDNTPSLGLPNDYQNAIGTIEGYVTNLAGDSLEGVKITYAYGLTEYTNNHGYFSLNNLAILANLEFQKSPYPVGNLTVQIWPDSVRTINVIIENVAEIERKNTGNSLVIFQLYDNFPNPFNPYTRIGFSLNGFETANLFIYNIKGEKIKTLIHEQNMESGYHEVNWNGTDDLNVQQSSGIYFAVLNCRNIFKSKKMILLR